MNRKELKNKSEIFVQDYIRIIKREVNKTNGSLQEERLSEDAYICFHSFMTKNHTCNDHIQYIELCVKDLIIYAQRDCRRKHFQDIKNYKSEK